jgi:hypothetical protein
MSQGVVFLTETRGIGLANMEFQRRTAAGLTMLKAIVQTAADNAEHVRKTIEDAREDFIQSSDDIVITDYTETSIRPWPMVHPNGSVVNMPVRFASTTPTTANLTRARPEAYLVPVAWPDLAERLRVAGLEVETLSHPWSGSVEVLTIESTEIDSSYFEGAIRVTATTSAEERNLELPAGSFLVTTRQRNAAVAFTSLEPENIDSLVSFNIIPVGKGDEYPVFRVL